MRRGIGVAHVQRKNETQQQMTDLGAQITAERVGQIADQLEEFEKTLCSLARKHRDDIREDPIVRARFRQMADSLGIDLISSKKNIFAGILGLGDFYYGLAGKVVEACMKERKFCGSYVPLNRIVYIMQQQYGSKGNEGRQSAITEADICMALDKLHVLGEGYNVVKLAGVSYIQTTPDGTRSADDAPLVDCVMKKRAQQILHYQSTRVKSESVSNSAVLGGVTSSRVGISRALLAPAVHRDAVEVETYVESGTKDIPLAVQCVAFTQSELESRLMWRPHRVQAVLERMLQNGSVWIEQPSTVRSDNKEEVSRQGVKRAKKAQQAETVYWFIIVSVLTGSSM
ncbi:ESCRT-II complex subunit VPS22 [Trypanosoma rangeli]|uniref:ESCRT-II complex subunit VPS22 n=1 Tax=Trypanosoma rangeli TaxID=5698 RepID=A0A3R7NWX2_TRYRA|nr:ESCRT-II complex subunit VPS22 [Trypanosoma rangeli]RNF08972.1 ESCRT-II complex subunit VPS22 [Trypanosoma rangeli]|eukprot:RNF08972.1 ESCRT-II complex subunit VPS22 [Trypanosoma rangeli]